MYKVGSKVELRNHSCAGMLVTVHACHNTYIEVIVQYKEGGPVFVEKLAYSQVIETSPKRKFIYKVSELYI